jgi:predicted GNAT superfamily acetyltransferase
VLSIDEVDAVDDLRAVAQLFAAIWRTSPEDAPVSSDLLKALAHTGGYVAAAWRDGDLVGASVGLLANDEGRLGLHSHISGVAPEAQGSGVGYALKLHQRAWALERGMRRITWTFDPLVRRNAWFNLVKLGAVGVAYHRNFYGSMQDGINRHDESDRCSIAWDVASERAAAAAAGHLREPDVTTLLDEGAIAVLTEAQDGSPVTAVSHADRRLCWVPADIVALRAADPDRARDWRRALRDTLGQALDDGLVATAATRSGWYVLETAHA